MCDVEKEGELFVKEMDDYHAIVKNLSDYSRGACVFVLIHKFDKVKDSEKK